MVLLFLESIGTPELLVILVVALVVLGPRRLPELGRKLGKGMSEFRRASDEFKRTWEREVDLDRYERERKGDAAPLPDDGPAAMLPASSAEREPVLAADANSIARGAAAEFDMAAASSAELSAPADGANVAAATATAEVPAETSPRKSDWL